MNDPIVLNDEESKKFEKALESPPEPNQALIDAMAKFKSNQKTDWFDVK